MSLVRPADQGASRGDSVTRGAPPKLSSLRPPERAVRAATPAQCPDCHEMVATRGGRIAGHYAVATTICSGSNAAMDDRQREVER